MWLGAIFGDPSLRWDEVNFNEASQGDEGFSMQKPGWVWLKQRLLLMRVHQWSKGLFVLLGVIYADVPGYWGRALLAAFVFCLIASAVYIYNDVQDIEEDKAHPRKSHRPLACGEISIESALTLMSLLLTVGLLLSLGISWSLFVILLAYLVINLLYNHFFRSIPLFDVMCIASGFMLRIFAGTLGIGLTATAWLIIAATLLSLYIALCKRRLELGMGFRVARRPVLKKYNQKLLNSLITLTASGCFLTYAFYTVYARDKLFYFILTLPFCAMGLWRGSYLAIKPNENDDPMAVFLRDNFSRLNLICFFTLTAMALLQ